MTFFGPNRDRDVRFGKTKGHHRGKDGLINSYYIIFKDFVDGEKVYLKGKNNHGQEYHIELASDREYETEIETGTEDSIQKADDDVNLKT